MNKQHKWAKEIKAWADGAEIESRFKKSFGRWTDWLIAVPMFHIETDEIQYRIKPQPKEPIINIDELGRNYTRALHDSLIKHKQNLEIEIANIIHEALNEIKPQPKEPQYLYVYGDEGGLNFSQWHTEFSNSTPYIGKIKLEVDDE